MMRAAALSGVSLLLLSCGEAPDAPQADAPETAAEVPATTAAADPATLAPDVAGISDDGVVFRFAGLQAGGDVLAAEDRYTAQMQPREAGIRGQDASITGFEEVKPLYRADVMTWSDEQKNALRQAVAEVMPRVNLIDDKLPSEVLLVLTGTVVEGGLPHTRANAIIFAGGGIPDGLGLQGLFLHELHHVLSRANRPRHDDYFAIIGYEPCVFEEPASLRATRLSNPDAPTYDHYAPVAVEGVEGADGVVPFLYATGDYTGEGLMPSYFGFGLLPVAVEGGVCTALADTVEGLLAPETVPEFAALLGGNTGYVIHPEETLADNFVAWALETPDLPSPDIPQAVGAFWTDGVY